MSRMRVTAEQIIAKLREAEVEQVRGQNVVRQIGHFGTTGWDTRLRLVFASPPPSGLGRRGPSQSVHEFVNCWKTGEAPQ
jgi:hypothetical protein